METPAGWYDDGSGRQRWWDGHQWTDQYADATAPISSGPATAFTPAATVSGTSPAATGGSTPRPKPHVVGFIALAAAVLGFIFACIPGALIVGWVLLPIAFVLSIVSLFLRGSKWPGIVGLIVAIIGTIIGFVVFFFVAANAANDAFGDLGPAATGPGITSSSPEPAGSPVAQAPDGKYTVAIGDATKVDDYSGKPALVVNYTFTNNSSKDVSFMVAVRAKAFQNGIELEPAIVMDGSVDTSNALKDVKPGTSIQVQWAYLLSDTTDVSVEVKETFDLSDAMIASQSFSVS